MLGGYNQSAALKINQNWLQAISLVAESCFLRKAKSTEIITEKFLTGSLCCPISSQSAIQRFWIALFRQNLLLKHTA